MAEQRRSFAAELRRRREHRGLSLRRLSELTHYSKGHLGNIEKGVKPPTPELAAACDQALDARGALTELVQPLPPGLRRRRPAARRAWVRPSQLPADVAGFTGRGAQLRALADLLTGTARPGAEPGAEPVAEPVAEPAAVCAIVGSGGVGKTALAVHAAHRLADRFPDGQLYADLRGYAPAGAVPPAQVLERFVRAVGGPGELPADPDELAAAYRSLLDGRRVLVLLDNAGSAEQVRPLLPGTAGCRVLVTSRDRLSPLVALDGAHRLELDVLTEAEAVSLLTRLVGADRLGDPATAAALADACARLPLALRIAAAGIVDHPDRSAGDYLARLRTGDRLAQLALDGDEHAAVQANLALSYQRLPAPARLAFRRLGLTPGADLTPAAAAALIESTVDEAGRLLDRLAAVSLVERRGVDRYQFHDLLRLYAVQRCQVEDTGARRQAAVRRLLDWYLRTADAAGRLLYPGKVRLPPAPADPGGSPPERFATTDAALAWLDAERANLVAVAAAAGEHGKGETAWRLADALRGYFWARRYAADWLAIARAAESAAEAAGDELGRAVARLNLGDVHWSQCDYPQALVHYTAAHDCARRAGWAAGEAATATNRGNVHQELGQLDQAAAAYRHALALYRRTGQHSRQAATLANLGAVHHQSGQLAPAAEHYAQALALHQTNGDRTGQALTLNLIGLAQLDLGRPAAATADLTRASRLSQEIGDRYGQARAAENLARAHAAAGHPAAALEQAGTAIALSRETGDRSGEAQALAVLAAVQLRLGDHRQALGTYRQAGRLAGDISVPSAHAEVLIGSGHAQLAADRPDDALRLARQAVLLTRRLGYRVLEGQALTLLAEAQLRRRRYAEAGEPAREALACHRATGHRLGEARTLQLLGELQEAAGDPAAAQASRAAAGALYAAIGAQPDPR